MERAAIYTSRGHGLKDDVALMAWGMTCGSSKFWTRAARSGKLVDMPGERSFLTHEEKTYADELESTAA